jgi:hypothetical protein
MRFATSADGNRLAAYIICGPIVLIALASCSLVLPDDAELLGGREGGADVKEGSAPGTLIFDEEFDGGSFNPNKWTIVGDGVWSIDGGTGLQSDPNATASLAYANGFAPATNYHIVARMRSTGPFGRGNDLAPEIAFRIDPEEDGGGIPANYSCAFDLLMNQLFLQSSHLPIASTPFSLPSGFDLATPFVLDAVVTGSDVTCTVTVDGLGLLATASTNQLARLSGPFGLKTYETTAQFFYFRVYSTN